MQLLDYFDQIYVINLPHRVDRRREMAEQLKAINLSFESTGVRLFEAIRPEDAGGFESIGTRGCFLSHLGVLRDAHARQFQRILLFEDDLNFARDFTSRIPDVAEALDRVDWSMFYGGYSLAEIPRAGAREIVAEVPPGDAIQTAHFVGFRGEAIGEIADFLEAMLSRPAGDPRGGPMHVDGAYGWYRREFPSRTTMLSVRELGYQRSSRTDIHNLGWLDRAPAIRHAMGLLRSVRNKAKT